MRSARKFPKSFESSPNNAIVIVNAQDRLNERLAIIHFVQTVNKLRTGARGISYEFARNRRLQTISLRQP